jgi:hypothetical protein
VVELLLVCYTTFVFISICEVFNIKDLREIFSKVKRGGGRQTPTYGFYECIRK